MNRCVNRMKKTQVDASVDCQWWCVVGHDLDLLECHFATFHSSNTPNSFLTIQIFKSIYVTVFRISFYEHGEHIPFLSTFLLLVCGRVCTRNRIHDGGACAAWMEEVSPSPSRMPFPSGGEEEECPGVAVIQPPAISVTLLSAPLMDVTPQTCFLFVQLDQQWTKYLQHWLWCVHDALREHTFCTPRAGQSSTALCHA